MNHHEKLGYWNEKKIRIKQKYQNLTDEDLHFHEGKEQEMMEMLGYKLGITKEELRNILSSLD